MKTLTLDQLLYATSKAKNRLDDQVKNGLLIGDAFITIVVILDDNFYVKDRQEKLVDTLELKYSYEKEGLKGYKITLRTPVIVKG